MADVLSIYHSLPHGNNTFKVVTHYSSLIFNSLQLYEYLMRDGVNSSREQSCCPAIKCRQSAPDGLSQNECWKTAR
jgi:hypothetical protein